LHTLVFFSRPKAARTKKILGAERRGTSSAGLKKFALPNSWQIRGNAKALEQGRKHPAEMAKIASGPDLFAAPIAFQNNSAGIRKVYWLDTNGERQLYRELKPGESYELGTYLSHPWVVTDADGNALGLYYPDGQKRTVTLE